MTIGFFVRKKGSANYDYVHDPREVLVIMCGELTEWEVVVTVEETDQTLASIDGKQFFNRCKVRFE